MEQNVQKKKKEREKTARKDQSEDETFTGSSNLAPGASFRLQ